MLDDKDFAILNLIQVDARLTTAQIAEKVHLSASSCWRKIKSMEEVGVIERYTVAVSPTKIGLNFEAIVNLRLDRHDEEGVETLTRLLMSRPEVVDCFATTGNADFQMRVLCADIEAYNQFLQTVLFKNTSVRSAQTNVVLKRIKTCAPMSG